MIEVEKLNLDGEVMSFCDIWEKYDPDNYARYSLNLENDFDLLDLVIHRMEYIKPDPIIIIEDKRILILYSLNGMKEHFHNNYFNEEDLIEEERFNELKQWKNLNSFFNDYTDNLWIDFSDYLNVVDVIGGLDFNKED